MATTVDTFRSKADIFGIEAPAKGVKEIWHEIDPGFGVRIAAPTKKGVVRRTYIGRVPELQPSGRYKDTKPPLGLVVDIGTGDAVIEYNAAKQRAERLVSEAKTRKSGGTVRMTMQGAYDKLCENLASPVTLDSADYGDKMKSNYTRFLAHLGDKYLDELKEPFWADYLARIRTGVLQVGETKDDDGKVTPVMRQAESASYALGVLNTVSRLYRVAHEHHGISGQPDDWDPTRKAVKKIEAPNQRETYLKFPDLATAWQATDQLMGPWWRDMYRVYLLTGLRDRLVMDMRFDQIDFARGVYLIPALARGAKRRRSKLSLADRKKSIEMPLSTYVLGILKRRQRFAPKGPSGEWVWYSTETRRKVTKELPRLTDPRASWKRLTPLIGYWVYKHDLRRTFASLAATVDPGAVMTLSLLLLHTSQSVSKNLGVPEITVKYIQAQQGAMRALTEKVSRAVLELVGDAPPTDLTAHMREYIDLPTAINQALDLEEKAPGREEELADA